MAVWSVLGKLHKRSPATLTLARWTVLCRIGANGRNALPAVERVGNLALACSSWNVMVGRLVANLSA